MTAVAVGVPAVVATWLAAGGDVGRLGWRRPAAACACQAATGFRMVPPVVPAQTPAGLQVPATAKSVASLLLPAGQTSYLAAGRSMTAARWRASTCRPAINQERSRSR